MVRAAWLVAVGLLAAACSPVARGSSRPPASTPTAVDASTPGAAVDQPAVRVEDSDELDWLMPLSFRGPEAGIAALCGPRCTVERTLPNVAPFKSIVVAAGSDPMNPQNVDVRTTYVVFEASDGWYAAVIFRAGSGIEDVEMVNPDDSGMPGFAHANRPVSYTGEIRSVNTIDDHATEQALVALELRRSHEIDGIDLDVLLLCGAGTDGHPACGELAYDARLSLAGYEVEDGIVEVKRPSGERRRYLVFYDDDRFAR